MTRYILMLLLAITSAKACPAQTDAASLERALKNKQMWLRNYSADPVAHYEWSNGVLAASPVKLHAIGAFITESVRLKHGKLTLEGERATLVRDAKNQKVLLTGRRPMKLEVDLQGADPAVVVPHIQEMMFFPDAQVAVAEEPSTVANLLPFDISRSPKPKGSSKVFERVFESGQWLQVSESAKIVPPRVVSSVPPKFTDEARQAKMQGDVWLLFYVSETGLVDNIWLENPLGYGLDEQAFNALKQYVFEPALYENKPVGVIIQIKINFVVT